MLRFLYFFTDIYFYSEKGDFGEFSNFWDSKLHKKKYKKSYNLVIDGLDWKSTEEYYQARKFLDQDYIDIIRSTDTPGKAAMLGRQRAISRYAHRWMVDSKHDKRLLVDIIKEYDIKIRKDWEEIKVDMMRTALRAKFTQNEELKQVLLSTSPNNLHEDTDRDMFWATGGKRGKGKDMLGKLLVELRKELI